MSEVTGSMGVVGRRRIRPVGAPEGTPVVVLPLAASTAQARELDLRFDAGYNVLRALHVYGRKQLAVMRESRAWRQVCGRPGGSKAEQGGPEPGTGTGLCRVRGDGEGIRR